MSNAAVHLDLLAPLASISGTPPVAYENDVYKPTTGTAWLRPVFLPDRTVQAALGDTGANRFTGILLVDVFCPTGKGTKQGDDLAELVMAAYARGTVLDSTTHVERSYRGRGRVDGDWYMVPVTVEYRADVAP